jgi:VWFA-related protein
VRNLIFTSVLVCSTLAAQDVPLRSQSRLVIVPVTITDQRGAFVDGLTERDFRLSVNGELRHISNVDTAGTGVPPISLVVAVQSCGISSAVVAKVHKIGSMIEPLITGERGKAALLTFSDELHWVQDFTSDSDSLSKAFATMRTTSGKTAHMLDAVTEAVKRLGNRQNSRRVLVLVSESRDRGSSTRQAQAVEAAQRSGVAVYALSYSVYTTPFTAKPQDLPQSSAPDYLQGIKDLARLGKANTVRSLTAETGGRLLSFTKQSGLEHAVEAVGGELQSQYVLSFVPSSSPPGYYQISVTVPERPGLRIRARPGYWAGGEVN